MQSDCNKLILCSNPKAQYISYKEEIDAAVFHFTRAYQIDPESALVVANFKMALELRRKVDDAMERLESERSTR